MKVALDAVKLGDMTCFGIKLIFAVVAKDRSNRVSICKSRDNISTEIEAWFGGRDKVVDS